MLVARDPEWLIHFQGIGVILFNGNNFFWAFLFLQKKRGAEEILINLFDHTSYIIVYNFNFVNRCSIY